MNSGYKQAVVEKKQTMAQKMGETMNGGQGHFVNTTMNARGNGGMKYHSKGVNSGYGKGMKTSMRSKGGKGKMQEKSPMSSKNHKVGDAIYTQAHKQ
jgi:hypothetical protein